MSLVSALHVGRTGLLVNQIALEVTGNNLANAATEGYSRQRAITSPSASIEVDPGVFVGTGVQLEKIVRHVDAALNNRLHAALADKAAAQARQEVLSQIETIHGELTEQGLSSRLSQFFNAWSELSNNPTDNGLRSLVINEGSSLAQFLNFVQTDLSNLRKQVDQEMVSVVKAANSILDRIAELNQAITVSESGQGGALGLRDERDQLVRELSEYFEVTTLEKPSGSMDILINSTPVVLASENRGLSLEFETVGEDLQIKLRVTADGTSIQPKTGKIGQLMTSREEDVNAAITALNDFTTQLIHQVNLIHSSGQGAVGFSSATSTTVIGDPAAALNSAGATLPFTVKNGTLQFHVTQTSTGLRTTTQIKIDQDGIGADTSANDLVAAINAISGVSASVGVDGLLRITSDSADFKFSFSDDTSGVLAALGINTFFKGTNAADISVVQRLKTNPSELAAGRDHVPGDNRNALAIAELQDKSLSELNGLTLRELWSRHIEDYAIRTSQTNNRLGAATVIAEGLNVQRQAISGVNIDEEAINMLAYQRAFQGSARFITVVDELMQTLLTLV